MLLMSRSATVVLNCSLSASEPSGLCIASLFARHCQRDSPCTRGERSLHASLIPYISTADAFLLPLIAEHWLDFELDPTDRTFYTACDCIFWFIMLYSGSVRLDFCIVVCRSASHQVYTIMQILFKVPRFFLRHGSDNRM